MTAPQPLVLLVEDEALIRMMTCECLQDAGLRVIEAADGHEALRAVRDNPDIDLIFTDVNMPGSVDGLELARRVHSTRPDIEIILTSGRERPREADMPNAGVFVD